MEQSQSLKSCDEVLYSQRGTAVATGVAAAEPQPVASRMARDQGIPMEEEAASAADPPAQDELRGEVIPSTEAERGIGFEEAENLMRDAMEGSAPPPHDPGHDPS